jgi:hypothetical protein
MGVLYNRFDRTLRGPCIFPRLGVPYRECCVYITETPEQAEASDQAMQMRAQVVVRFFVEGWFESLPLVFAFQRQY